ncbi:phenylacrylic acid decarboxylase [Aspergillus carlsbadensis]|nr:phenylacrylic acid decarboxylase [Aspergillus carlsbadensis]
METGPRDSQDLERQEIDRVLRLKRKQRESKACYPCRQRKVKCNGEQPCRTCTRRDHPQICAYNVENPPSRAKRRSEYESPGSARRVSSHLDAQARSPGDITGAGSLGPSSPVGSPEDPRQHDGSYVFAGDNSLVSMLHQQDPHGSMARDATSVLGLHNTYLSYPFTESKTPQERWAALIDVLPHRDEVLKFFHFYRICAYPFNPILVDVDRFESDICLYLSAYASGELRNRDKISGNWLSKLGHVSLLLATLAAGAHFSDLENPQRSELCQDFARRSFHALRLANFLFRPSLDAVQALLILGNTLQNNGQSDAAWALLGTTVRLAQTLGIHTVRGIAHWPEQARLKAKALWSMTVWQDSLLSLCYDRPPIVSTQGWAPDAVSVSSQSALSYTNVMHYLCWIALRIISLNEVGDPQPQGNLALLAELDSTYARAQPHLLERSSCGNLQQHLEHLALRMHTSFCVSVLCRPALKSRSSSMDPRTFETLRLRAKASLIDASKAFLDFQALSVVPLRTWSMVHTVLSSTLLLCIWPETREDPECRDLQQRAIEVFSGGSSSGGKETAPSDYSQWLSARHIRALVTLRQSLGKSGPSAPVTASEPPVHNPEPATASIGQQPTDSGIAAEAMPMGDFPAYNDFFSGLGYGYSSEMDFSPLTYLDSLMNVPLFDLPEEI